MLVIADHIAGMASESAHQDGEQRRDQGATGPVMEMPFTFVPLPCAGCHDNTVDTLPHGAAALGSVRVHHQVEPTTAILPALPRLPCGRLKRRLTQKAAMVAAVTQSNLW